MLPGPCWRCELPGHIAAECQRPPATSDTELRERISRYMERVIEGQISVTQKQRFVAAEWAALKPKKARTK